jgi:hypothetical protein
MSFDSYLLFFVSILCGLFVAKERWNSWENFFNKLSLSLSLTHCTLFMHFERGYLLSVFIFIGFIFVFYHASNIFPAFHLLYIL